MSYGYSSYGFAPPPPQDVVGDVKPTLDPRSFAGIFGSPTSSTTPTVDDEEPSAMSQLDTLLQQLED